MRIRKGCDFNVMKKSRHIKPNHPDQDVAIKIKRVHTYNVVESKRKVTFLSSKRAKNRGLKKRNGKNNGESHFVLIGRSPPSRPV